MVAQDTVGAEERLRLAELIAGRICHDLSGPLGTLMGSLEMISDDPDGDEEAMALANEVAVSLTCRLRLFRAAWGGAPGPLPVEELRGLAGGLPQAHRLVLNLDRLRADRPLPSPMARTALNLLLLAAESLPAGGTIVLAGDPEREIQLGILGQRAAWPAGLAAYLADPERAWAAASEAGGASVRVLQAPLTALIARSCGLRLSMLMGGDSAGAPPLILSQN